MDPETVRIRLSARQKQARAAELRLQSYTWQQIADAVGYSNQGTAYREVMRYFKNNPSPEVEELRAQENEKLDRLEGDMLAILASRHIVVNNKGIVGRYTGKVQRDEFGDPMYVEAPDGSMKPVYEIEELQDDDPAIRAAQAILRIMDRRAKLNGLDKPIKVEIDDGGVDKEIEGLVAALTAQGEPVVPEGHEG